MSSVHPPSFDGGPLFGGGAARPQDFVAPGGLGFASPGAFVPDGPRASIPAPPAPGPNVPAAATTPTAQRAAWAAAPTKPTPLPKQAKGRFFIASMLGGLLLALGVVLTQGLLRFSVYGVVTGRVLEVAGPWEGTLRAIYVRDGDTVSAGQVLFVLENAADELRLDRQTHELRAVEAELVARTAELRLNATLHNNHRLQAQSEYFSMWGNLLAEEARLQDLAAQLKRGEQLLRSSSISQADVEGLRMNHAGQRAKVEKLTTAVDQLRDRAAQFDADAAPPHESLRPNVVQMENILAEMQRLRQQMELGQVRAPVGGRIVRRLRFPGERVAEHEPVIELLAEDSLEIVLFLPQNKGQHWNPGQEVPVHIDPHPAAVRCTVTRWDDQLRPAPRPIERYYASQEQLLPVHLRPLDSGADDGSLRVGSVVRLPRQWRIPWSRSVAPN